MAPRMPSFPAIPGLGGFGTKAAVLLLALVFVVFFAIGGTATITPGYNFSTGLNLTGQNGTPGDPPYNLVDTVASLMVVGVVFSVFYMKRRDR